MWRGKARFPLRRAWLGPQLLRFGTTQAYRSIFSCTNSQWRSSASCKRDIPISACCRGCQRLYSGVAHEVAAHDRTAEQQPSPRLALANALDQIGAGNPSEVQQLSAPILASGASALLVAPTGSGKTLAYLSPLMLGMKEEEERFSVLSRPGRPRMLVLAPTRELAQQIGLVSKHLCHSLKLSSAAITGGVPRSQQRRRLRSPCDVLVATPGRLLDLV